MKALKRVLTLLTAAVICFSLAYFVPNFNVEVYEAYHSVIKNIQNWFLTVTGNEIEQPVETEQTGLKGEGTVFNGETYAYYAMLDDTQKQFYDQLYTNINALEESFTPSVTIDKEAAKDAYTAMMNDHPEIFWLDDSYEYKYVEDTGEVVLLTPKYNDLAGNLEQAKTDFNNNAVAIIMQAQTLSSDEEKERYVHDTIVNLCEYNLNAIYNQTAYSVFVNHSSVCAGYAKAFQYCMMQLGLPCYYVTGTGTNQRGETEDHGWNMVYINGRFVNVDVTWDDTSQQLSLFYNQDDATFSQYHTRTEMAVNLPACN